MPLILDKSKFFSVAIFFASGEIRIRLSVEAGTSSIGSLGDSGKSSAEIASPVGVAAIFDSSPVLSLTESETLEGSFSDTVEESSFCGLGASTSSPSSPTNANGLPMGASSPSSTRILSKTPSSKFSSSMVALSVSISASVSPLATVSPTFLCHLTTVPTDIVSLSFGISIITDIIYSREF